MYKIPSERGYKSTIMNAPAHAWSDSLRKLQFSKLRPKNWLNLHTQSLGHQWLQFVLASIFSLRWVVCCVFTDRELYIINILNQSFYLATFVRFYLSAATFNTFNTIWTCATFYTGNEQKDNAWVVGYARLFWITHELRTQINWNLFSNYSIARCHLNLVKKCITYQTVKKLIAFRSRRFIACHSKPSILNNAGVMWCAKGSRMRVLMLAIISNYRVSQKFVPLLYKTVM